MDVDERQKKVMRHVELVLRPAKIVTVEATMRFSQPHLPSTLRVSIESFQLDTGRFRETQVGTMGYRYVVIHAVSLAGREMG